MNRDELIQLATEKKIKYRKNFLKEADDETIEKICVEYKAQQLDQVNELVDVLVEKFSDLLTKLEMVKKDCNLEDDLTKTKILKKDLKTIVGYVTPYVPFVGLISGGITIGGHVVNKKVFSNTDEQSERSTKFPTFRVGNIFFSRLSFDRSDRKPHQGQAHSSELCFRRLHEDGLVPSQQSQYPHQSKSW